LCHLGFVILASRAAEAPMAVVVTFAARLWLGIGKEAHRVPGPQNLPNLAVVVLLGEIVDCLLRRRGVAEEAPENPIVTS